MLSAPKRSHCRLEGCLNGPVRRQTYAFLAVLADDHVAFYLDLVRKEGSESYWLARGLAASRNDLEGCSGSKQRLDLSLCGTQMKMMCHLSREVIADGRLAIGAQRKTEKQSHRAVVGICAFPLRGLRNREIGNSPFKLGG